jgi:glycosyltransferase involved in cell wall biosynthesis
MISVIIPAYNEAGIISATINNLKNYDQQGYIIEIIVCDGGSTDTTIRKHGLQAHR